jgi:alkylation response protein AidB-like acyl-CoA dehydrogenase
LELLRGLRSLSRRTGAWDDVSVRRRVGHLGAELDALWALARRNVSQAARTGVPGIGGSVYKLALSELRQRIAELGMDLAGPAGLVFGDVPGAGANGGQGSEVGHGTSEVGHGTGAGVGNLEIVSTWVHSFSRTIAAGTSQIQRNIIAERILGLPKG